MENNVMSAAPEHIVPEIPGFAEGIDYFGEAWPEFAQQAASAAIAEGESAIGSATAPGAAYQTLLGADALRYLTLQVTGAKGSGHPGGFASSAEAHAALMMLGHTNIVTEVGHHAPGFYSAMFLDSSLETMGIDTVSDMRERFREREGLLGHLSGAVPGILSPAGPLGQGQHFAMAGAVLHPDKLFPVTLGDGGMGEPYPLSAMMHFNTAFPHVTNFLPVLIWNGYSQEHHAMVATWDNQRMIEYWRAHGFQEVVLIDARDFDDSGQDAAYVDSTRFSFGQRLAFQTAVLEGTDKAARSAMGGTLTAFIIKQLKGSGVHTTGSKSHNLYPADTLDQPHIADALKRRALHPRAWQIVRDNFTRAGGGPAVATSVTEKPLPLKPLGELPVLEHEPGDKQVPATALGALIGAVGRTDPSFVVTNADGNEASAMKNINEALGIRHPTTDGLYNQRPDGQVYEPLSEDACAGIAAAIALFGGRSIWLSYESFAINGWPIFQTVTQAMAELRRRTPSTVAMFTAGALEQGRNGWTHQRPEIENYVAAQMRNGNVYALFPTDANMIQATYEWALETANKGIAIFASKSPLPVRASLEHARQAVREGASKLHESTGGDKATLVFAVTGDMVLLPVFEVKDRLETQGYRVRIVAVVNPRRLYRPRDVAWETCSQPDGEFMTDRRFDELFDGDLLCGVSGGPGGPLEPVMLRSRAPNRELMTWKRGETAATPGEVMAINGLSADLIATRVLEALG
jgi:phosphoketolase